MAHGVTHAYDSCDMTHGLREAIGAATGSLVVTDQWSMVTGALYSERTHTTRELLTAACHKWDMSTEVVYTHI